MKQFILSLILLFIASIAGFVMTRNIFIGMTCILLFLLLIIYGVMFRDPHRKLNPQYKNGLHTISPIDGYISLIQENYLIHDQMYSILEIKGDIFSTNANFIPITGTIREIHYHDIKVVGKKNKKSKMESRHYYIKTKKGDEIIYVKKAVGDNQIVSSIHEFVGAEVQAGQKFGFMKFGNTSTLYMPNTFRLVVSRGTKVTAGLTVIATAEIVAQNS